MAGVNSIHQFPESPLMELPSCEPTDYGDKEKREFQWCVDATGIIRRNLVPESIGRVADAPAAHDYRGIESASRHMLR